MGFRYRKTYRSGPMRVTVSKRGVGFSVGGKRARVTHRAGGGHMSTVHLGPGMSYTTYSHAQRSSSSRGRSSAQVGGRRLAPAPSAAAIGRAQLAAEIDRHINDLTSYHRRGYPRATPQQPPPPAPIDPRVMAKQVVVESRVGISWWKFSKRAEAKKTALTTVSARVAQAEAEAADAYAHAQAEAAQSWSALEANDQGAVAHALLAAFKDYEVPTVQACAGEGHAVVALCYPDIHIIPEQKAATTATGATTVAKRSQTDRNQLWLAAASSLVIDAARRALGACPFVIDVTVAVIRESESHELQPVYCGLFPSNDVAGFGGSTDPISSAAGHAREGFSLHGQTHEVTNLSQFSDPFAQALYQALLDARASGQSRIEETRTVTVDDGS